MISILRINNKRGWILYELAMSIAFLSFLTVGVIRMIALIESLRNEQIEWHRKVELLPINRKEKRI